MSLSSQRPVKRILEDETDSGSAVDHQLKRNRIKPATTISKNKSHGSASKTTSSKTSTNGTSTGIVKRKTNTNSKIKKENDTTQKRVAKLNDKQEVKDEDADEEKVYKWWENQQEDDSVKWTTLQHSGVLFPPPYEPLPKDVKLLYNGEPVDLPIEAEEVAGFFGAMLDSDHAKNPTFCKNFFADFCKVLKENKGATRAGTPSVKVNINKFKLCDFSKIHQHFEQKRVEKKALSSAQKSRIKAEKEAAEEKFKTCIIDGRKETAGNFRIEPPSLFRGRGAHPKTGKLKARVQPEQVTINIGKEAVLPEPPTGHKWGEVRHDNTVSWLAMWKENINSTIKYVFLAQSSSLKGMSDYRKFEKARELKNHVERIRKDYMKELNDESETSRQRATAMYLIDVFALRAGGEKGDDEADTVGCCSLRYEHVTLRPPRTVVFDFLGKDSIRYHQEVQVEPAVYRNLKQFKKAPKKVGSDIFDRLDPSILNKHLQSYLPGLTAKVFRTYNATHTMQQQLDKIAINTKTPVAEKIVAYNAANRAVAILCNHQRTVAKGFEATLSKYEEKLSEQRWNINRLKKMVLLLEDPGLSKSANKAKFAELSQEFDKDKIAQIQSRIIEREVDRITKKFTRDNESLLDQKEKPLPESALKDRLSVITEVKAKEFKRELETGKPEVAANATHEKLVATIAKMEDRLAAAILQLKDKEDNSQVALGTSKMNYIDPRLTVMFSKKHEVPIEKLFSKTLREKFKWAIESADADWRF